MNDTPRTGRKPRLAAAVAAALGLAAALPASADESSGDWEFRVLGYGFVPDISGTVGFPAGGAADIEISAEDLVENTHVAAMAAFEAQKGRFGGFVDVIFMDVGDSIRDAPAIGAGSLPLPPGITADATLDVEATVFTAGLGIRPIASEAATLDLFAGARKLDVETTLDWSFSAPFGPFVGPAQAGTARVSGDAWDAIAGAKGQASFGADRAWFVPFYADAGTGDSDLTWQLAAGIGYRFGSFAVIGSWRYLRYEFDANGRLEDLELDGPAIGVGYRW
jgi:hypothetical protein